jgi:hypothetical protein
MARLRAASGRRSLILILVFFSQFSFPGKSLDQVQQDMT